MQYVYLAGICFSLLGMVVLDKKYQLALWYDARRTLATLAIGVAVFIVWDVLGIALGIFFSGHSRYMSGIYLGPEFPVEELLFLIFLCYFTLVMYRLGEIKWLRT